MPNRSVHAGVGIPVGIGAAAFCARRETPEAMIVEAVGGALGGLAGALLPDVIDPPSHPNHRGLAHGAVPIGGLAYVSAKNLETMQKQLRAHANRYAFLKQTAVSPGLSVWYGFLEILMRVLAGAIAGFIAAYASHVILDFTTPRSLPLVA